VHDILHVDEAGRALVFSASGVDADPDPYVRKIYRIGLDGTGMTALTPSALDHEVVVRRPILPNVYDPVASHDPASGLSPSGRHLVVTASRIDRMPVTHLLRGDGSHVAVLETAEMTPELAADWRWPKPFVVKGRDGTTDIHGALWLPADFDPGRRYPILDLVYPGPQRIQTPKAAFPGDAGRFALYAWARAYAELGIAVVTLDGMGTPYRSKAFHDVCVGNMGDAGGLADHVAGLRRLAHEAPYLDTSRVGIIGHSGGGFAAARALLAFPEFFTVGIASAGNHDQRGYSAAWGERYQGLLEHRDDGDNFEREANAALAHALRGKLLLATGEMDENVHISHTMRLADELIAHNKDFELVVVPNANHATLVNHPWFVRKRFDFLMRHLLWTEPPAEYRFMPAGH
jgi:dipeptidyl-peptidase-4